MTFANKRLHNLAKMLIILLLTVGMFGVKASAEETSSEQLTRDSVDSLIGDFESILPPGTEGLSDISNSADALGIEFLFGEIIKTVKGGYTSFFTFFLLLVGIALLVFIASSCPGNMSGYCKGAASLIGGAIIFERLFFLVKEVSVSLSSINDFFSALIPIATATELLGLSAATASAESLGMAMTLGIYSSFSGKFLLSLSGILLVVCALSHVEPELFQRLGKSIKGAIVTLLGALTTLIGVTFSLQNLITSRADSGTIRTARYAISGMIPLVGNTVSGALGTLLGSVSYAKGVIGGGAIAVIVVMACAPLVTLLVYRLTLLGATFLSELASVGGAAGLFKSFLDAIDVLIAIYSLTALVYVVEIAVFLKGGAGVA